MRFQTKLLFTYSLLIVLLTAAASVLFYGYSADLFERNALNDRKSHPSEKCHFAVESLKTARA